MARLKDIAKAWKADGFKIPVKPASEPASNGREAMHYTVSSA
jgi:hypothetical protein